MNISLYEANFWSTQSNHNIAHHTAPLIYIFQFTGILNKLPYTAVNKQWHYSGFHSTFCEQILIPNSKYVSLNTH